MESRYEIRGKIGQGGLGSVYRAYDTRMNREVAIKRIPNTAGDPELLEESTRQLIKEAGALASLQHPHIVTIYDVGTDEDGPYVVMELIAGNTLDELIERAPLTWADFREMALQTQEALIAAQELNLIHSDLKPSNLMLTWLPSGKFQIKIVDFGLASLSQSQSKQELEKLDAVFGSVFFMPPEQFERIPLDMRSDVYSMGCVYYQALTGIYPFDGKTGQEVMNSHLQHTVRPLQEVRAGIPLWACDWIMWQINRFPQDRPESSREALSVFLKNDRQSNPKLSTGAPPKPAAPQAGHGPPRPRMIAPGGAPRPAGQPAQVKMIAEPAPLVPETAAQPLAPPEGFKPSIHDTSTVQLPLATPAPAATTQRVVRSTVPRPAAPPKMDRKGKLIRGFAIVVMLVIIGLLVMKLLQLRHTKETLSQALAYSENPSGGKFKVDSASLTMLLDWMTRKEAEPSLGRIGKALAAAEATDGTNIDLRITEFINNRPNVPLAAKEVLIDKVLNERKSPAILPAMMEVATTSKEPTLIVAALQAVRKMAGDDQLDAILKLVETTDSNEVRMSAELNVEEILRKSRKAAEFGTRIKLARDSALKPETRKSLNRLVSVANSVAPPAQGE